MIDHPISDTYLDQQQARVFAALLAAGAWDVTPLILPCAGFEYVTLYISYIEGGQAVNGAVNWKIESSPDSAGTIWHQLAVYDSGNVIINADTTSNLQREDFSYGATTAAIERFPYGPIPIHGTAERLRVFAREIGDLATPGSCEIEARFS
jgi:hypothetical protein